MNEVLRYNAFTDTPAGGNPAGVVLDAEGLADERMLAVAAEVGYSETAFLRARSSDPGAFDVRYFSPVAEVPFCGHATIAAAVALAERDGPSTFVFHTVAGRVAVDTRMQDGQLSATLTSVAAHVETVDDGSLDRALRALHWADTDLDPALPPRIGFAGARHLILAAATRERLADLEYDFEDLKGLMLELDLTTVHLVWRENAATFHARDPFPVGGVVEDPATGAAAAAFGAYLRELGLADPPASITTVQGEDMGRPSSLQIDLESGRDEVKVSGAAVRIGLT